MNDQEFREHILAFITKSEQWMQDARKKLDAIDDLQQQVSSMRDKLEGTRESETPLSPPEIRVVKGAHADNPDPLLALAGTLKSDVTDISERHDDYIAAALLAELRGDEDEN